MLVFNWCLFYICFCCIFVFNYFVLFFKYQGGEMLYAWDVRPAKDVAYPLNPPFLFSSNKVTPTKSKELWSKAPKLNSAVYEEKENFHYFTHLTQNITNSHHHGNVRKKGDPHQMQDRSFYAFLIYINFYLFCFFLLCLKWNS